jgi:hypothetical protein
MTLNLFGAFANLFGGRKMSASYRKDLLTWAKIEYANDWQFAYNYMIENDGQAPTRHTQGIN